MDITRDCKSNLEITTSKPIELVRSGNQEFFRGYAVVFFNGQEETEYRIMPNVRERISRTAFDNVLKNTPNIMAWYNHNEDFMLGQTEDGSLSLIKDDRGISFEIPFDADDPDHQKVKAKILKGFAKGASFQANGNTSMKRSGNEFIRTIEEITELLEISIVNRPAYRGTEAVVRDIRRLETEERIRRSTLL
ncbi:HK97 family phage prohead protease [Aeoliella sp.]|uniref:HK97 family phage prohead protease n=1 Tax=Aeoliella sp. TaxID=2795800 RepID=UPI003CCB81CD